MWFSSLPEPHKLNIMVNTLLFSPDIDSTRSDHNNPLRECDWQRSVPRRISYSIPFLCAYPSEYYNLQIKMVRFNLVRYVRYLPEDSLVQRRANYSSTHIYICLPCHSTIIVCRIRGQKQCAYVNLITGSGTRRQRRQVTDNRSSFGCRCLSLSSSSPASDCLF